MESQKVCKSIKWFVLLAFIAMLTVNALSSILPINGVTRKKSPTGIQTCLSPRR